MKLKNAYEKGLTAKNLTFSYDNENLILKDASIDMQTAYEIESCSLNIEDLTLITITHNLREDNLKRYDNVVYMDNGMIEEVGVYEKLMERQGGFYDFS
ncbi:MAG: hypothetical protein FWH08_07195 [Oscillospiraceae bacterium]|nr:hypothetical protein [Oscillospiraceae bacterium]